MKRLIYFAYLGLLAFILFSCQKEEVMPVSSAETLSAAKTVTCPTYSYTTKTGTVNLGGIRSGYVLIDFDDNVTQAQQLQILKRYNIFDALEPEFYMDSGLLSVARLKARANCLAIEAMIADLHTKPEVQLATPTFEPFPGQVGIFEWMGLTGEFIVEMKTSNSYSTLQELAAATGTTIVMPLFNNTYLLLADKNSKGTPLQVISTFNASDFVNLAEPNYVFQYAPFRQGQPNLQTLVKARLNATAAN